MPHCVGWTAAEGFAYSYGASLRGYLEVSNNLIYADVAQLVEHHLAKVRVAGSSPVVRSEEGPSARRRAAYLQRWVGREARQRTANPCTPVQIRYPPRAVGAVGSALH